MMRIDIVLRAIDAQLPKRTDAQVRQPKREGETFVKLKACILVRAMAVITSNRKQAFIADRLQQPHQIVKLLLWRHGLRKHIAFAALRHYLAAVAHIYP